jgi:hypothetical protein
MPGKTLSALVAVALLGASTAAAAQTTPAPAPQPAMETIEEGSALNSAETLGIVFGLIVLVILIWQLGDKDEVDPIRTSP